MRGTFVYLILISLACLYHARAATLRADLPSTAFTMATDSYTAMSDSQVTGNDIDVTTEGPGPPRRIWVLEKNAVYHIDLFYKYWSCVIPIVGLITNSLSILVFATRGQKDQTVNMLLLGLAISDTLSLLTTMDVAVRFITDDKISWMQHTEAGCRLIQYCNNVARDCSSFFILTFTIDRFIAVHFPLKRASLMTKKRVKLSMAAIVVFFSTAEIYWIIELDQHPSLERCFAKDSGRMGLLTSVIRNTVGFLVPGVLVAILNALIINRMQRYQATRSSMTSTKNNDAANRSLTIMLVTVSTFSFIVFLPKVLFFYYLTFGSIMYNDVELITAYVADCLGLLNYSCNFFFYCLSGSQFRQDLKNALLMITYCGGKGKREGRGSYATRTSAVEGSRRSKSVESNSEVGSGTPQKVTTSRNGVLSSAALESTQPVA